LLKKTATASLNTTFVKTPLLDKSDPGTSLLRLLLAAWLIAGFMPGLSPALYAAESIIMTDSDNTGESATAWYGDIFFSAE
jgi:hypothetical protein